jgi:VWFA-related protein
MLKLETCLRQLSIVTFLAGVMAQEPDVTVFRATSRLVQVNVIVNDKNGSPVHELTRGDFILTDNGRPQDISVFTAEAAEPGKSKISPSTGADPLTVNNRTVPVAGKSMPVTVILFDALNILTLDDLLYGKREAVKFLRTLQPGDPVALYSLNGPTVRVIHDFTDDANSLIQVAQRLSGVRLLKDVGVGPAVGPASNPGSRDSGRFQQLGEWFQEASRADEAARLRTRTEWTLTALEDIAHHLTGFPGRKNLIWISGAFPITIGLGIGSFQADRKAGVNQELYTFSDREKRIGRLFTEAQVAVYPMDPASLVTDQIYSAAMPHGERQIQAWTATGHMVTAGEIAEPRFASMRLLAKQTGGLAFYNANDLAGSIRRAVDDARVTYTLGFYPPATAWDGKYHDLKVLVKRAGFVLRAREGYFASASGVESEPDREQALRLAVASPLEGEAIGVKVHVQSNPLDWWGQEVVVVIDPHDIRFEERDGRMRSEVDLLFVQQAPDGHRIDGEKQTLQYALLTDSYETALGQGLFFEEQITIEPQASRLRIVVRDASTGAVGSVSVPVRPAGKNHPWK